MSLLTTDIMVQELRNDQATSSQTLGILLREIRVNCYRLLPKPADPKHIGNSCGRGI